WYNQPTGQFYHISADNQFPYWVYGTEQDSGSIGTSSRGNYGSIGPLDWTPHPGFEFGSIVADPLNPKVSYAGGDGGGIARVTLPSRQWINVSPNVDSSEALRKVTNQPLLFSPANPRELIAGFQCVMATTDGGARWKKLSPDLTRAKGAPEAEPPPARAYNSPLGAGGAAAATGNVPDEENEEEEELQAFGPSNAIESISVSALDGGIIWAGTNNGLI